MRLFRHVRVSRSDQLSPLLDGIVSSENQRHDGTTGHEGHQAGKEFFAVMFAIEIRALFRRQCDPSFLNCHQVTVEKRIW